MKMLFISEYICAKGQGAYMVSRAHYQSFCELIGKDNIDVVAIKTTENEQIDGNFIYLSGYNTKIDRLINILSGYPPFYSKSIDKYIINLVKKNLYDFVFFDNSYFGSTIRRIKKMYPNTTIYTFFHGVKANSGRKTITTNKYRPQIILSCFNNMNQEKNAIKYSNKCILLNKREENELTKYYKRKADAFLPIYCQDSATIKSISIDGEFRILFLGGKFWPNIKGITWFAEHVMPYLDKKVKLYVVGRGMECLREELVFKNSENIEVVGGTDNLDYWYNSSDIVVGPIFHGDGMKTKTAEALMYGKRYIGTDEALCGYIGLDDFRCNTAEEFINLINKYIKIGVSKYYPEMRKLYEENYSIEAANKKIAEIINLGDKK